MRTTRRMRAVVLAALALLLMAAPLPCRAEANGSVVEAARRATAFVFADFGRAAASGTAFCIDASGLFITNNHVIEEKGVIGRLSIVLSPGTPAARVLSATVVKTDPDLDLAVLRVDRAHNLHPVDLASVGRLEQLRETQEVMALGYPFGTGLAAPGSAPEVSVSTGKVTALRHVQGVLAVIQFDGSINPGNSGGPLLDAYGNVVGVVRAIIPGKQINFAIPASHVRALLAEANIVIAPPLLSDAQSEAEFVAKVLAPPAGRRAVPSPTTQESERKLAHDLFATAYADKSREGQAKLVYELLDEAAAQKDAPFSQYALLTEAREAAVRAGDFTAGVLTTLVLIDKYDVPPVDLLGDVLKRLGPRLEGQDAADGAALNVMVIEGLARQEAYAQAVKLIGPTRAMAYTSHNAKVIAAVAERAARVEFGVAEHQRAQAAVAKLKSDLNDPDANLAVGRYQCFVRGDFTEGCAFLAKGSQEALKRLAQMELAKPATADAQKACGDAWWEQAAAETKAHVVVAADACKARAVYWYRQALPKLTGLQKRAIAQRLPDDEGAGSTTRAATGPITASPAQRHIKVVDRTGSTREAGAVIDAIDAAYPQALETSTTYELVKVHNASEFRCNGGAGLQPVAGTYGGSAVAGQAGAPMLWGIYEKWSAGRYLVVYRVQARSQLQDGKKVFLDVCSAGTTVASRWAEPPEFHAARWDCMPIPLNLERPTDLEFRLWPDGQSIALDRIYVFKVSK